MKSITENSKTCTSKETFSANLLLSGIYFFYLHQLYFNNVNKNKIKYFNVCICLFIKIFFYYLGNIVILMSH